MIKNMIKIKRSFQVGPDQNKLKSSSSIHTSAQKNKLNTSELLNVCYY